MYTNKYIYIYINQHIYIYKYILYIFKCVLEPECSSDWISSLPISDPGGPWGCSGTKVSKGQRTSGRPSARSDYPLRSVEVLGAGGSRWLHAPGIYRRYTPAPIFGCLWAIQD